MFNETERMVRLARREELRERDWLELLQRRADDLKPWLHDLSVRPLGDFRILSHGNTISSYTPEVIAKHGRKHDLDTRGLFPVVSNIESSLLECEIERIGRPQPYGIGISIHRVWGLTKGGRWIAVIVHNDCFAAQGRETFIANRVERVEILEMSLSDLCEFACRTPQQIWEHLGLALKVIIENKERTLAQLQDIASYFRREQDIVETILHLGVTERLLASSDESS